MVDGDLRRQIFACYDQRAREYEEAYTLGTGTSPIRTPGIFTTESSVLEADVREWGRRYQVSLEVAFHGSAFLAVVGRT